MTRNVPTSPLLTVINVCIKVYNNENCTFFAQLFRNEDDIASTMSVAVHGLCQEFLARQAAGRCDAWCHLRISCGGEGLVEIIKVGPGSSDKWGPHNNSTYRG